MANRARRWSHHPRRDQFGETVVGGVERRESCNGTTPISDDDLFTGLLPIGVAVDATPSIRP